jgi:hypothetical protein
MKKIFLFFVFSALVTFMFGQNLSVYLIDGPRGSQHKVGTENSYRLSFLLSGLSDEASVTQFINKCKSYQGIVDITVNEMDKTGQRSAVIIFNEKKESDYFKAFLIYAGITKVYSQNKEYTPENIGLISKDRETVKAANPSPKTVQK